MLDQTFTLDSAKVLTDVTQAWDDDLVARISEFIEVPATTTCAKQGITDVPAEYCHQACEALGFKYAGGKAEASPPKKKRAV